MKNSKTKIYKVFYSFLSNLKYLNSIKNIYNHKITMIINKLTKIIINNILIKKISNNYLLLKKIFKKISILT